MTNTLQTNSFVGGMNMDIDIHAIPENQYRYAENIRIITDTEGTSGVTQQMVADLYQMMKLYYMLLLQISMLLFLLQIVKT